jgi:hypothetical protein
LYVIYFIGIRIIAVMFAVAVMIGVTEAIPYPPLRNALIIIVCIILAKPQPL